MTDNLSFFFAIRIALTAKKNHFVFRKLQNDMEKCFYKQP